MAIPGPGTPGKLPFEVSVSIRGPLYEVTGQVLDLSAMGLEVLSPKRFPDAERVGLTIRSMAVRGPGCIVPGDIGIQREQPDGSYFIRIDFVHSAESQKNLQAFLWGVEEARQTKRRENPPGLAGRGPRSAPASRVTPRGSSGGASPSSSARGTSFPPLKLPGSGSRNEMGSMGNAGAGDGGKLPVEVTALIRGPLYEVTAKVLDMSATGLDAHSTRRVPPDERVGLTLTSAAVRGPGIVVSGDVRTVREQPGAGFFVRIDFAHTGDSEKKVQSFLWGLEEARQTKRRDAPPGARGRGR